MQQPSTMPLIGVYSATDWARQSFFKSAYENKVEIFAEDAQYSVSKMLKSNDLPALMTDSDWDMAFVATDETTGVFHSRYLFVTMDITAGQMSVTAVGTPDMIESLFIYMDSKLDRAGASIEWIYNSQGHCVDLPLQHRDPPKGAYPWLPEDVDKYIDDYLDSTASVLILIGPPGTGKTSFIKHMIHRSAKKAKVTYDTEIMSKDHFFASFISDDSMFLIAEDADNFMAARSEGNNMMHRFLNVSDGLISSSNKKIVFSTNLPSIEEIDPALLRPGRCHDVLEFRKLNRAEAKVVAESIGTPLPDGNEFTLAELFNTQPSQGVKYKRRGIGFTA